MHLQHSLHTNLWQAQPSAGGSSGGGVPTLPGRTMDTQEAVACGEVWGVPGRSCEPRHVGSGYGAASAGEFPFNNAAPAHRGWCWPGLLRVSSPRTAVSTAQGGPPFGRRKAGEPQLRPTVYQVLPDGAYIKLGVPQTNYLSMVVVRVEVLLGEVIPLLQKACIIAIRYSVIRRQSRLRPRQGAPSGATTAGPPDPTVSAP